MSSGSMSATCAPISGVPPTLNLIFRSWSVITAQSVTSLPVPAVVGIATSGGMRCRSDRGPTRSRRSSRRARPRRRSTSRCRSTTRRRARRARRSLARVHLAPSSTSAMSGFGRTSSKTTASSRCSSARSARPAATTPGSVTSRGRVTPSSRSVSPSRAIAPGPWTSRVGTSTERTVSTSTGIGSSLRTDAVAARCRWRQCSVSATSLNVKIWKPAILRSGSREPGLDPLDERVGAELPGRTAWLHQLRWRRRNRIEAPSPIEVETRISFVRETAPGMPM